MARRIGIFGGSFNPVHLGHLILAQDALDHFLLDEVWFTPANLPPHKRPAGLLNIEDRLAMLQRALEGDARFVLCDEEVRRGGVSYTVDTVRRIREARSDDQLFLLVGGDTLLELHTWKDIQRIVEMVEIITVARPGFDLASLDAQKLRLPDEVVQKLKRNILIGHLCEISSTDIRQRAARSQSIRYLVPEAVERYILDHKLFQKNPEV